jgi:hypothetical protein
VKEILLSLKDTLLALTPGRSFCEAMLKADFKVGDRRRALMQLCFSSLAAWPLAVLVVLVGFCPLSWQLTRILPQDHFMVLWLLDGRLPELLIFFAALYVLQWILRLEYVFLILIFYGVRSQQLHINLAVAGVLAIYLSRISYQWWLSVDCASVTKTIWKSAHVLQLVAWVVTAVLALSALDYLQRQYLFSENGDLSRFNFLVVIVLLYHAWGQLILSLWGHFYFQKNQDPSDLAIHYSTAQWLLRFKISKSLRARLRAQVSEQLAKHQQHQEQMAELRAKHPALGQNNLQSVLTQETVFLSEANLRLTKM